jgi:hypothetical protein
MNVPVRSFFRCAPDSACSARLLSSSKTYDVPARPDQLVGFDDAGYYFTWHMLELSVFEHTETHVCDRYRYPRSTAEESGLRYVVHNNDRDLVPALNMS